MVGALNHMIDDVSGGKSVFYDFYTEQAEGGRSGEVEHRACSSSEDGPARPLP